MSDYQTILFDVPSSAVARITMNRPEARNAQDVRMTFELNAAFDRAAHDDAIKVIILAGSDPHFSAGHDLRDRSSPAEFEPVGTWGGFGQPGAEGYMAREEEIYLGMCRRWRSIPKPMIAQVQGKCIAGGLMLAWVCDLIVASDDAQFQDPVVQMGVCGVEYFAHPWELGARKAKELLFTADWFTAAEAHRLGMVNQVVPRGDLERFTLGLAERIARKPSFALKLVKEAVNQTQEAQGQWTAMLSVFNLHQLCHSHNMQVHGMLIDPSGIPGAVRRKTEA